MWGCSCWNAFSHYIKSVLHLMNKLITADIGFQIGIGLHDIYNLMAAG